MMASSLCSFVLVGSFFCFPQYASYLCFYVLHLCNACVVVRRSSRSDLTLFGSHCANRRLLPVPLLLPSSSPISSLSLRYSRLASSYHLDLRRDPRIRVTFNRLGVFRSEPTVRVVVSQIVYLDLRVVPNRTTCYTASLVVG